MKTRTIGVAGANPSSGAVRWGHIGAARLIPAHGKLLVDRVDVAGKDSADALQFGQSSR